jgi:hypothetical protein
MGFVRFQKERVEKREIADATLRNFVKAIKLFCEMSDISVPLEKDCTWITNNKEICK